MTLPLSVDQGLLLESSWGDLGFSTWSHGSCSHSSYTWSCETHHVGWQV